MATEELTEAQVQEILDSLPEQPKGVILKGDDGQRYFLTDEAAAGAALENSAEIELFEALARYSSNKALDSLCQSKFNTLKRLAEQGQTGTEIFQTLLADFVANCIRKLVTQGPAAPLR